MPLSLPLGFHPLLRRHSLFVPLGLRGALSPSLLRLVAHLPCLWCLVHLLVAPSFGLLGVVILANPLCALTIAPTCHIDNGALLFLLRVPSRVKPFVLPPGLISVLWMALSLPLIPVVDVLTPPLARVMHSGTPIAAAFKAGSRRGLGRAVRSRAPAVLPQLLRHICFMALMQQAAGALSTIDAHLYPTFQALGASPLITTAADPPLRFSPKENKEMTYRQGVASMPPEEVRAALVKELDKLFITHKALRPISPADIRPDAVRIYSSMLLKAKFFGDGTFDRISARLAAGGNTQPEHSYDETYAPTADEASTL